MNLFDGLSQSAGLGPEHDFRNSDLSLRFPEFGLNTPAAPVKSLTDDFLKSDFTSLMDDFLKSDLCT